MDEEFENNIIEVSLDELVAAMRVQRADNEALRERVTTLQAELAAIKAQEPVAVIHEQHGFCWYEGKKPAPGTKLYAAPVSEAKAREPDCDRSACGDFSPGPCDNPDCSARRDRMVVAPAAKAQGVVIPERSVIREVLMRNGFTIKDGQDDLKPYVYAAAEELLRLAATVQQVSVPDGWREMLEELQWQWEAANDHDHVPNGYYCPSCRSAKDKGHAANCEIATLIDAPAAPAADACKACKGTGRRPIGGRGRIFGLTNRCFECQPLTAEEVYGSGDSHD